MTHSKPHLKLVKLQNQQNHLSEAQEKYISNQYRRVEQMPKADLAEWLISLIAQDEYKDTIIRECVAVLPPEEVTRIFGGEENE